MLAGATPQVLASAAMTRSFDVKDEIEFTDNLDKKPETAAPESVVLASTETSVHISNSVRTFLVKFQTISSLNAFALTPESSGHFRVSKVQFKSPAASLDLSVPNPIDHILSIANFPRGSLDPLLLSDAK